MNFVILKEQKESARTGLERADSDSGMTTLFKM